MWKTVKLGDVCTIKTGKKDVNEGNPKGAFPFFTCAKEHTYSDGYSFDCEAILIAGNGAVGQTTYYKGKFEAYQRTYVLSDFHSILPKLLLFILQGQLMNHLSSMVLGNTIPYIKKGMLQNFEFPLPPLAEQQRIVAKLDAAFAEIDRAILASSDSTNQLRSLSSNSAKEIFITLRDSGKVSPINDVCEAIFAGGDAPKDSLSDVREGKYQIPIFANAMKDKGLYGYTENPRVKKPSVTVAGRGSGTGYTEIRREPFFPIVRLIVLTPNDDEVTVEFLKHAIVNLEVLSSGSAIPQLTVPMMKSYEIPVPPLDQQRVLTEKLDTLQRIADECMGFYEKKVESLKTLKSAILSQELQPPQREAA